MTADRFSEGEWMTADNDPAGSPDFSSVQGGSSTTAPGGRTVTVKSGDSLSKIAKRELGDANRWTAIYEANKDKIKNPDLIHPGQVLTLPSS
jgi:nucleoid-associated protein YgaU